MTPLPVAARAQVRAEASTASAPACAAWGVGDVSLASRLRRLEVAAGTYEWAVDMPYGEEAPRCRRLAPRGAVAAGAGAALGDDPRWSYDAVTRESVCYAGGSELDAAAPAALWVLLPGGDTGSAGSGITDFRLVVDVRVGVDAPATRARLRFGGTLSGDKYTGGALRRMF